MSTQSLGKQLVAPTGVAVLGVTALAWYASIRDADSLMGFAMFTPTMFNALDLVIFYGLMTTMMIAMMLPATLPMVLGYRSLLKANPAAGGISPNKGTLGFLFPYVLLWGSFGVVALLVLGAVGVMGPLTGLEVLVPGTVLIVSGLYQLSSLKQYCLTRCQSPFTFVLGKWRNGLGGALRMGLSHSKFCVGCCWMLMVSLFVTGAMSLQWMGIVSVLIFLEKVGIARRYVASGTGGLFIVLGIALSAQAYLALGPV